MQIIVNLDQETVMKYQQRGSSLFFEIYWQHGGVSYPEKGWTDFGVTILGWWFFVVNDLRTGVSRSKFSFMDGPYAIEASYNVDTGVVELTPKDIDVRWRLLLTDLVTELVNSATKVCQELQELGVAERERLALEKNIQQIKLNFGRS